MKKIKQIFLDLDGPLLDGKYRHYSCYSYILKKYGFSAIALDEYWEKKRSLLNRRDLLQLSNASSIYDEYLDDWLSLIESQEFLALDKVQEGAIDCLRAWKSLGVNLVLVTLRKNKEAVEEQLHLQGLASLLDTILVCDHVSGGLGKANAVRNCQDVEIMTENSVWVGDTEVDWEAARSLGVDIILVENGLRNKAYLEQMQGSTVVPSIQHAMKLFGLTLDLSR
ncbi:HAD hydrolase-like protein [Pseudomonas sp. SG20052]|uniref:HAD family hydrolase n=1 Tax=Pseudomonas sp. SG20052 TaxID=3074147 RepID=UPI00287F653C|nr:HAD hydrolase-like protein [Pseudomonas sp. SG20052]WNF57340.1 HAD hydrolase-like protein [Pseudomonas sp. SG20052]